MTRTFSDGHPKVLPACNILSQYYFYNIFLQKSCRFSLQTLTKFEASSETRHLPIVLVKVAYYASGSARFLPKLCSNYARFSKLCYFFKKLFCAQTSQLTRQVVQVVQVVQALVYPLCSRYLVNYLDVSSLHLTGLAWLPPF